MKRFFLAAAFGLAGIATFAAPTSRYITYRAKESFAQQFGAVKNVTWTDARNHMVKAEFELDEQKVTAFFNEYGEYLATSITVNKTQLPFRLRLAMDNELKGAPIDELIQVESANENAYYFKANQKVYKAYGTGEIQQVSMSLFK
jgi:type II secretory pathway component GspD/PulD (secretin)